VYAEPSIRRSVNIARVENRLVVVSEAVGVSTYDFDFDCHLRLGAEWIHLVDLVAAEVFAPAMLSAAELHRSSPPFGDRPGRGRSGCGSRSPGVWLMTTPG
jgi:hypothetical protein